MLSWKKVSNAELKHIGALLLEKLCSVTSGHSLVVCCTSLLLLLNNTLGDFPVIQSHFRIRRFHHKKSNKPVNINLESAHGCSLIDGKHI